jgi:DMSO/TMAO reductase YedYZ molybdopterin-dependent catalytic subunit
LGYKHAKYVRDIMLVDSLAGIQGGNGGYWEDYGGYEWYAGI